MYKNKIKYSLACLSCLIIPSQAGFSQGFDEAAKLKQIEEGPRLVQTAVPFIGISPNARASGMGDQGVATSADENSAYWNPGKLSRIKTDYGGAISHNPWLRYLTNDMSLSYLSVYYRLRKQDVVGLNMSYFDLGTINFTDINQQSLGDYNPREVAISGTYSRLLSDKLSAGISLKYIYSNLSGNTAAPGSSPPVPGQTGAADVGFYYNTDLFGLGKDMHLTIGAMIANIGGKVSYGSNRADFIPTTMRLGAMHTTELDEFNKISLGFEASKLMVPSATLNYVYLKDKNNKDSLTDIRLVSQNAKPLIPGMLGSFGDAPFGFREEMQEIALSFAAEYWYDNLFAIRTGYFYENLNKGNRNYFTVGLGLKYKIVGLDISYLIPTTLNNPLANTIRFSLSFNFEKPKEKEVESILE